ncbi:MAG: hypothetical protein HYY92_02245 [Parcubacteria group bacterium]|nr:hypothetical protein [Parcubacteria group bacterium]
MESQRYADAYFAVLRKRFGCVTGAEFLRYARRLAVLCDTVYNGSTIEIRKNHEIPIGRFALLSAGSGWRKVSMGEKLDINTVDTSAAFRIRFLYAASMKVEIFPLTQNGGGSSRATIEWTCQRPKTIFFRVEEPGRYDKNGRHPGTLQELLTRKMFHVHGVAPGINSTVRLGILETIQELESGVNSSFHYWMRFLSIYLESRYKSVSLVRRMLRIA